MVQATSFAVGWPVRVSAVRHDRPCDGLPGADHTVSLLVPSIFQYRIWVGTDTTGVYPIGDQVNISVLEANDQMHQERLQFEKEMEDKRDETSRAEIQLSSLTRQLDKQPNTDPPHAD